MNINIKATNTELTEPLRQAVTSKLEALEKFIKPEHKIYVELEHRKHVEGEEFRAEIRIAPEGFYADATGEDFFAALDLVIPKISQQMRREKDKKVSLRRRVGNLWKRFRG